MEYPDHPEDLLFYSVYICAYLWRIFPSPLIIQIITDFFCSKIFVINKNV
jgi:hypothetical protein